MWEGLGMEKIWVSIFFSDLMFSMMFVSVKYFQNHLCISISPEILKEFFTNSLIDLSFSPAALRRRHA